MSSLKMVGNGNERRKLCTKESLEVPQLVQSRDCFDITTRVLHFVTTTGDNLQIP